MRDTWPGMTRTGIVSRTTQSLILTFFLLVSACATKQDRSESQQPCPGLLPLPGFSSTPTPSALHYQWGLLCSEEGRHTEAELQFTLSIAKHRRENDISLQAVYSARAIAYRKLGRDELFLADCQKVFDLNPGYETPTKLVWGERGRGDGQFRNPWGIALGASGDINVVDSDNERIQRFDTHGKFLSKIDLPGSHLKGIATDMLGFLYVTDGDWVRKLGPDGGKIFALGGYGTGNGQLSQPLAIAVDPKGIIYVADTGNNRIQTFNDRGRFLDEWVFPEFYPRAIHIANENEIWVGGQKGVLQLDSRGVVAQEFTSSVGAYTSPVAGVSLTEIIDGIAVTIDGRVIITTDFGIVWVKGSPSSDTFPERAITHGYRFDGCHSPLRGPRGIIADAFGSICVVDSSNSMIVVFGPQGITGLATPAPP